MPFTLESGGSFALESSDLLLLEDESSATTPPVVAPPIIPQSSWRFVLCDAAPSANEFRELATAYGRRLTLRLDGVSDAQFSLDGNSEEAAQIGELSTDLVVYRQNPFGVVQKIYRGRIITEQDYIYPDNHSCQFSTNDYRGMLERRFVGVAGRSFSGVDIGTIAFTLISDSQALTAGNWGITNGIGATAGTPLTIAYDPGSNISEMITNLGHRQVGGFEWEIDANLALNRWYPERGASTGALIDYGGVAVNVVKTLTSGGFGNAVIVTGDGEVTTAVIRTSPTIATDLAGRWEQYASYSGIRIQSSLDDKGDWLLGVTEILRPQYVVTLAPGMWDRGVMNLGDAVRFICISGRTVVNAVHRIVEINIVIDESGIEEIKLGLVLA